MEISNRFENIINEHKFDSEDIDFVVKNFYCGKLTKEQMSKFLFFVCEHGFNDEQVVNLTKSMMSVGEILDMSNLKFSVDKHSTGGVSDSTTLICVPLFALLGFSCYKMSGGALGHTGGTADKLQIFDGIDIELTSSKAIRLAKEYGGCFSSQTNLIAPIDKKIYALRNEIGAVMSIPLIASSIMSKKLSVGAKNIILDVKYGNGALIADKQQAEILAKLMCKIGKDFDRNTRYILGDMNQPLGNGIGDYYEVMEVLYLLKYYKKCDLTTHSIDIVCSFCDLIGLTYEDCFALCENLIKTGKVYEKLEQIITKQGGKMPKIHDLSKISGIQILAKNDGVVKEIQTARLGKLFHKYKDSVQGAYISKRINDPVKKNECIIKIFADILEEEFIEEIYSIWEIK